MRKLPHQFAIAQLRREPWVLDDPMFDSDDEAIKYLEKRFVRSFGGDIEAWTKHIEEYDAQKKEYFDSLDQ